ncbi:hypothetical protein BWQ96_08050 [Gracilariopsis chorda]|uniref:Uncharacterized protein n=1 Tax=Gracilariopsis chorda TaxID=448386 RepID=A0A2V3IJH2_9FLOR|nr:hypothetical protein BWQ96_08050 [Gracilariopsis chorda]|eukprot:PXF42222.1 hypothetical protein BWQ96_08050 [Gracilariopsis chorda]
MIASKLRGMKEGFCVFRSRGFSFSSNILHLFPRFDNNSLQGLEDYDEFNSAVLSHSSGELCAQDVIGKHSCGTCRYLLTKGSQGTQFRTDTALLRWATDRCLVDCILFALDESTSRQHISAFLRFNSDIADSAGTLRASVLAPFHNLPFARFLPVKTLIGIRCALHERNLEGKRDFCDKNVESRIAPVLAARKMHLYSLSRKLRCYATQEAFSQSINGLMGISESDEVTLMPIKRRELLSAVDTRFLAKSKVFRNGSWLLSEEVQAIPQKLWTATLLDMASNKQLAVWKVEAAARKKKFRNIFPISNDARSLPAEQLNNFVAIFRSSKKTELISRADFMLCMRVLKVIEQMVMSRSRVCVGPLTTMLSIAGIIEFTASWRSVLHALGLVTSYDRAETFRRRLISKREQAERGAFDSVRLEDRIVTVQLDNVDMLPVHNVKAFGESLPILIGTATQGIIQCRKRKRVNDSTETSTMTENRKDVNPNKWLRPKDIFKDRVSSAASFNSKEDRDILVEFCDLVFGIVLENRSRLLAVSHSKSMYRRGRKELEYKHQGIYFRLLLLSSFKQHGGADFEDPSLFEQDIVFVDVSRMSASDIMTIHRKLSLIAELLTPGNPGSPRFVVVAGDQPTYKMLVKIWRTSYSDCNRPNPTSIEPAFMNELQVHEWMIPFPGFFHIDKQSLAKKFCTGWVSMSFPNAPGFQTRKSTTF